jgi:methylaspartate ammonia-lyase
MRSKEELSAPSGRPGFGTRIADVIGSVGLACDYYTDSAAMQAKPPRDGLFVHGRPLTDGFEAIHQRARCLNIQLLLDDGSAGLGDCLSVIRSGAVNRAAPLRPEDYMDFVANDLAKALKGMPVATFRGLVQVLEDMTFGGQRLHPGIAYGVSQAMLDATAAARRLTMAEVIAEEYDLPKPARQIPIFGCCDARREPLGIDQLIAGRADALPHGGFTSIDAIGTDGEVLLEFVSWMRARILTYGEEAYRPVLHLDVYGTIGEILSDPADVLDYIQRLIEAAAPLRLRLEDPVTGDSADSAQEAMRKLVAVIDRENLPVEIVADEYCNTREDIARWAAVRAAHMIHVKTPDLGSLTNSAEAMLDCRRYGVGVYLGGTMNDTEVSARASVHLGLAFEADVLMAKPGQWPDVSLALTRNEMMRTLQLCARR